MSDDLNNRGPADRSRISLEEDWELRYWTKKFGCFAGDLEEAIAAVGNNAERVEVWLKDHRPT